MSRAAVTWASVFAKEGAKIISPSRFADSDTFYSPTFSATYSLTPARFTEADVFFATTITLGAVNLAPNRFTDTDIFYAPIVTAGAVNLAPGLFTEADVFFAPTVTPGAANLAPGRFTEADTFYAPTVAAGATNLAPGRFTEADTFFAPTVLSVTNLAPGRFTDTDIFYGPTVSASSDTTLFPSLFVNPDTFYALQIGPAVILRPSADEVDGGWTNELGGTILYPSIDEEVIDDLDYIQSSENPVNDIAIVKLSQPTSQVTFPLEIAYRYGASNANNSVDLRVRLLQAVTSPAGSFAVIASWEHLAISTVLTTVTQPLTLAQFNAITDFDKLYLEFMANVTDSFELWGSHAGELIDLWGTHTGETLDEW